MARAAGPAAIAVALAARVLCELLSLDLHKAYLLDASAVLIRHDARLEGEHAACGDVDDVVVPVRVPQVDAFDVAGVPVRLVDEAVEVERRNEPR